MASLPLLIATYLLGGLTFVPLLLALGFAHAYLTLPTRRASLHSDYKTAGHVEPWHTESDETGVETGVKTEPSSKRVPSELKPTPHVPDVAAGYFAVCREYVPGGINGKPPERTTPAGTVVSLESPSVYQAMYRSIFDRNKSMAPSMDAGSGKSKKGRNVFYVVLRHAHLMLYDDSEQLEVRHVISLAHYDVDIYAGGDTIPEGELWIKRNCIRLTQRIQQDEATASSKPFYLFSDNCSEKEDFYHAILQNQGSREDVPRKPPVPSRFSTPDLVRLVQQLHASEENLHTRWINALIGRLFLSLYKTAEIEKYIWTKLTKKIARVPKPALISSVHVQKVDMGNLPPFITNPKLKELTVDGDLTIEADISYKGNFGLEICAIARIELGPRFKAREVTLVLATILKRLEGHVLVRIKPPPSNRIWITFESAPKMDFLIEPIVSTRQITYGVILRAIESRIREVVGETLVLPNWDDFPFSDTIAQEFRGGIWKAYPRKEAIEPVGQMNVKEDILTDNSSLENERSDWNISDNITHDATKSVSTVKEVGGVVSRKPIHSNFKQDDGTTGLSSATDTKPSAKPRPLRSGSFAQAASPIINLNVANASVPKVEEGQCQQDAATAMKTTISRSQPTSPAESPVGSPSPPGLANPVAQLKSASSASMLMNTEDQHKYNESLSSVASLPLNPEGPIGAEHAVHESKSKPRVSDSLDKRPIFNQSINSATAVAKKWFAARQRPESPSSTNKNSTHPSIASDSLGSPHEHAQNPRQHATSEPGLSLSSQMSPEMHPQVGSPAHPIGRGQPLPPPGTPLPLPPKRNTWSVPTASAFANLAKRRAFSVRQPSQQPVVDSNTGPELPPRAPSRTSSTESQPVDQENHVPEEARQRRKSSGTTSTSTTTHSVPPPLPKRRQRLSVADNTNKMRDRDEGLLVVEAPHAEASAPTSPTIPNDSECGEVWDHENEPNIVGNDEEAADDNEVFQDMELEDGIT